MPSGIARLGDFALTEAIGRERLLALGLWPLNAEKLDCLARLRFYWAPIVLG
jgi:hypothetical protein